MIITPAANFNYRTQKMLIDGQLLLLLLSVPTCDVPLRSRIPSVFPARGNSLRALIGLKLSTFITPLFPN